MTSTRARRRRLVTLGVVLFVVFAATCAELWRRDRDREERLALLSVLVQAATSGLDPAVLDPRWPHLRKRLREEVRAQPAGEVALLAYRSAARLHVAVPENAAADRPFMLGVQYGDEAVARAVLDGLPPFRWETAVHASWDAASWVFVDDTSWSEPASPTSRVSLNELLPAASFAEGMHVLQLRGSKTLYLPDQSPDPVFTEAVDLGRHAVRIGVPRPTAARP